MNEERKMQDIQNFLNTVTIALVLAFITLILLHFFAGVVDLWNQSGNCEIKPVSSLPHKSETARNTFLPYLKPTSKIVQINISKPDFIASNTANNLDTESLKLLIQQLSQSRVRTAARRLGIPDRVDGKYQKLEILRTQLKAKLQSQPMEVAQVFRGLKT
jgi:hypothetical protein